MDVVWNIVKMVHMMLKNEVGASTEVHASIKLKPTASWSLHNSKVGASIRLYPIVSGYLYFFKVGSSIKL